LFYGSVILAVRQLQGRIDEVAADFDASTSAPNTDMFLLARAIADAGRIDEAEPCYLAMADAGFPIGREPYAAAALTNLAYLAALLPGAPGVAQLFDKLEPFDETFPAVIVFQHVGAHSLGMLAATLGRTDEAHRFFERAVELHTKIDAPLMVAETQLEWARVCYGTGNVEKARELIGKALGTAVKGNAAGLRAQAEELLSAAFAPAEPEPEPEPEPAPEPELAPVAPAPVAPVAPAPVAPAPVAPAPVSVPPLPPVPPPPAPIPVYAAPAVPQQQAPQPPQPPMQPPPPPSA
jgi:tetratricopeptide (TPR) repeat protein